MKQDASGKPKPFLTKERKIIITTLIIATVSVVSLLAYLDYLDSLVTPDIVIQTQTPEPENTYNVDMSKFDIADFGKCVKLLIDYTKLTPYQGETDRNTLDDIKQNDILSQYNELNCSLVENQLSQTPEYKHRNDLPVQP